MKIRPASPAIVDYNEQDRSYLIEWPSVGLAVMVSEDELRGVAADAIAVQSLATIASDAA